MTGLEYLGIAFLYVLFFLMAPVVICTLLGILKDFWKHGI